MLSGETSLLLRGIIFFLFEDPELVNASFNFNPCRLFVGSQTSSPSILSLHFSFGNTRRLQLRSTTSDGGSASNRRRTKTHGTVISGEVPICSSLSTPNASRWIHSASRCSHVRQRSRFMPLNVKGPPIACTYHCWPYQKKYGGADSTPGLRSDALKFDNLLFLQKNRTIGCCRTERVEARRLFSFL